MVSLDIMLLQLRTPFFVRFTFQICKYVSESGSLENALPLPTLINILLLQVSIKLCVCSICFSVFSAPPRRSTHVSSDMMVTGEKTVILRLHIRTNGLFRFVTSPTCMAGIDFTLCGCISLRELVVL